MSLSWPSKDPAEILDYQINWASVLGTDTITSSVWAISDPSLTTTSNSFSATATTIWLSGGTVNATYGVKNTITTAGGRTFDQTATLKIALN